MMAVCQAQLLALYSAVDSRYHRLCFFLRSWARKNAQKAEFPSVYALKLMLLSFMQEHKMLPLLQKKYSDTNVLLKTLYINKEEGYRFHPVKYNVGMMSIE